MVERELLFGITGGEFQCYRCTIILPKNEVSIDEVLVDIPLI